MMARVPSHPPISLIGQRARLRVIDPGEIPWLYRAELEGDHLHRWRFGSGVPSIDQYVSRLWAGVHSQYLVVNADPADSGPPIGMVTCYNLDALDGTCYIGAIRFAQGLGASATFIEGCALFFDSLFFGAPIRKLYFEGPDYNIPEFQTAVRIELLNEEGRLRQHRFLRDRYYDHVILSLFRERWIEFRQGLAGLNEIEAT